MIHWGEGCNMISGESKNLKLWIMKVEQVQRAEYTQWKSTSVIGGGIKSVHFVCLRPRGLDYFFVVLFHVWHKSQINGELKVFKCWSTKKTKSELSSTLFSHSSKAEPVVSAGASRSSFHQEPFPAARGKPEQLTDQLAALGPGPLGTTSNPLRLILVNKILSVRFTNKHRTGLFIIFNDDSQ